MTRNNTRSTHGCSMRDALLLPQNMKTEQFLYLEMFCWVSSIWTDRVGEVVFLENQWHTEYFRDLIVFLHKPGVLLVDRDPLDMGLVAHSTSKPVTTLATYVVEI